MAQNLRACFMIYVIRIKKIMLIASEEFSTLSDRVENSSLAMSTKAKVELN